MNTDNDPAILCESTFIETEFSTILSRPVGFVMPRIKAVSSNVSDIDLEETLTDEERTFQDVTGVSLNDMDEDEHPMAPRRFTNQMPSLNLENAYATLKDMGAIWE